MIPPRTETGDRPPTSRESRETPPVPTVIRSWQRTKANRDEGGPSETNTPSKQKGKRPTSSRDTPPEPPGSRSRQRTQSGSRGGGGGREASVSPSILVNANVAHGRSGDQPGDDSRNPSPELLVPYHNPPHHPHAQGPPVPAQNTPLPQITDQRLAIFLQLFPNLGEVLEQGDAGATIAQQSVEQVQSGLPRMMIENNLLRWLLDVQREQLANFRGRAGRPHDMPGQDGMAVPSPGHRDTTDVGGARRESGMVNPIPQHLTSGTQTEHEDFGMLLDGWEELRIDADPDVDESNQDHDEASSSSSMTDLDTTNPPTTEADQPNLCLSFLDTLPELQQHIQTLIAKQVPPPTSASLIPLVTTLVALCKRGEAAGLHALSIAQVEYDDATKYSQQPTTTSIWTHLETVAQRHLSAYNEREVWNLAEALAGRFMGTKYLFREAHSVILHSLLHYGPSITARNLRTALHSTEKISQGGNGVREFYRPFLSARHQFLVALVGCHEYAARLSGEDDEYRKIMSERIVRLGVRGNERQWEAVMSGVDEPLVIVAGPGSGKSRTLVARVYRLMFGGVLPEELVIITFSNDAVKSLMDTLAPSSAHGSISEIYLPFVTTIDAFAECIRRLYLPTPAVLNIEDDKDIVLEAVDELLRSSQLQGDADGNPIPEKEELVEQFNAYFTKGPSALSPVGQQHLPTFQQILTSMYNQGKASHRTRLIHVLHFLQSQAGEHLLNYYQHCCHFLIDEYQDILEWAQATIEQQRQS
ncbi:hypothetical protein HDV00_000221 [Rhizophlyctis rosea]|nr:hypothetical protein HDV00_000221 [Rhizophlyctis rosea]